MEELVEDDQIPDFQDTDDDAVLDILPEDTNNSTTTDQQLYLVEPLENSLLDNVDDDYDILDVFTDEELEELEEEEIEILEELLDDPDIDTEIVEDLEELFDEEEITEEEIIELTENDDYEELPTEARQQVVQAVQAAPVEVRQTFEAQVNVFSSDDYANYVAVGSRIDTEDRKTVIAVTAAATAISSSIRSTATVSTGPATPTGRVRRG